MFIANLPIYRTLTRLRSKTLAQKLYPLIAPGSNILDFGCGNMYTAEQLLELIPDIRLTGIDVVKDQNLSASILLHPNVRFITSTSLQLPFPDNTFDVVLALAVMHHTPDPEHFMREIKRVLKPGGHILLVEEMYIHLLDKWYICAQDWILNRLKEGVPVPLNFFSNKKYELLFKSMGLNVTFKSHVRPFPTFMHHYVYQLQKNS